MRRIILVTTLAMMLSVVLITLPHKMEGHASASNANLFLAQGGGPALSINDATLIEGNNGSSNMLFTMTATGLTLTPSVLITRQQMAGQLLPLTTPV